MWMHMAVNQTNRHRKMEVGNPLEILEYHQSYKISLMKKLLVRLI